MAQRALSSAVAAFWLVVGVLAMAGVVDFGVPGGAPVIGVLLLANGVAIAGAAWLTVRGRPWLDHLAMALLAFNAVTSLSDEVGVLDVASSVVNLALLALLIANVRRVQSAVRLAGADSGSRRICRSRDHRRVYR